MNILVTGAGGFAGSWLVDCLVENGYSVRGLLHSRNEWLNMKAKYVYGDVTDYYSVLKATEGIDAIFHLAAVAAIQQSEATQQSTYNVNVSGTHNVLKAAEENKVKKFVHVSTCHVLDPESPMPQTEESPVKPVSAYAVSKYASELATKQFLNKIDIVITRAFNHFGPRQTPLFFIANVIKKALTEPKIVLGDPYSSRDYCLVTDIVNGYRLALEKGKSGEIYQFCSAVEKTIQSIAQHIAFACGRRWDDIEWNPNSRQNDLSRSVGVYTKARNHLGWRPQTSFDDGIDLTIAWWRERLGNKALY